MINTRTLFESVLLVVSLASGLGFVTGLPLFGLNDLSWYFGAMRFPPLWIAIIVCIFISYYYMTSFQISGGKD